MRRVLVAWVGKTDLRAPTDSEQVGVGPIAQALETRPFEEAFLLADCDERVVAPYVKWLRGRTNSRIEVVHEKLSGPTQFGEIHEAAVRGVQRALSERARNTALSFHLSPGTPAMAAVWILLGKTRFPAELIESSKDHGVRTASVPFDISADFIPDFLREQDERLRQGSAAESPEAPEFADIVHRSRVMARLIQRARRVAVRNVPVLIEGESGTGKEMLARAINRASPRRERHSSRSTVAPSPPSSSNRSSSVTRRARSPMRSSHGRAISRPPRAARCSWTSSASCPARRRSSSSVPSRRVRSCASAPPSR